MLKKGEGRLESFGAGRLRPLEMCAENSAEDISSIWSGEAFASSVILLPDPVVSTAPEVSLVDATDRTLAAAVFCANLDNGFA